MWEKDSTGINENRTLDLRKDSSRLFTRGCPATNVFQKNLHTYVSVLLNINSCNTFLVRPSHEFLAYLRLQIDYSCPICAHKPRALFSMSQYPLWIAKCIPITLTDFQYDPQYPLWIVQYISIPPVCPHACFALSSISTYFYGLSNMSSFPYALSSMSTSPMDCPVCPHIFYALSNISLYPLWIAQYVPILRMDCPVSTYPLWIA